METILRNGSAPPPTSGRRVRRRPAHPAVNQLSSTLLQFEDDERRRIARQLHDTVGQSLAALQMNLCLIKDSPASFDPRSFRALMNSVALTQTCALEIRNLSYALYPPLLDELGLLPAL